MSSGMEEFIIPAWPLDKMLPSPKPLVRRHPVRVAESCVRTCYSVRTAISRFFHSKNHGPNRLSSSAQMGKTPITANSLLYSLHCQWMDRRKCHKLYKRRNATGVRAGTEAEGRRELNLTSVLSNLAGAEGREN